MHICKYQVLYNGHKPPNLLRAADRSKGPRMDPIVRVLIIGVSFEIQRFKFLHATDQ